MKNVELKMNNQKRIDTLQMKQGYMEMAMINLNIAAETFHAEEEADMTLINLLKN